ncbi:hypothetical protein RVBP17_1420 [Pseudomonas phage sp. 30-3]|nr:hypothetical protein GBBBJNDB_00073 [Pseudomonas phage Callisto]WPK39738.1 hypothetical protein ETTORE_0029 [Pseudomonas phage Ettore]BDR26099.1 hypothetical protein RVBP17_1420 [Pseudomonas phage sp. 30-3]
MSSYQSRFDKIMSSIDNTTNIKVDWDDIKNNGTQAEFHRKHKGEVIFGYNFGGKFYYKHGNVIKSLPYPGLEESVSLQESRPTRLIDLISSIGKCDFIKDIVSIKSTANGIVALVSTTDGNAYEITLIPAEYSTKFPEKTNKQ